MIVDVHTHTPEYVEEIPAEAIRHDTVWRPDRPVKVPVNWDEYIAAMRPVDKAIVYGIAERKHIKRNLETIEENIHAAVSMVNINMPVKLIALAEGELTGFTDEAFDLPHILAAKELFIDIPGEETEFLGRLAKLYDTYIIAQCKARWPEVVENRFFNTLFIKF